jgi:hypothetical protein
MNNRSWLAKVLTICLVVSAGNMLTRLALAQEITKPEITQAPANPKRALFVGNSFSFFNDGIHNHLGALIRSSGNWERGIHRYRLHTLSGARMEEHRALINEITNESSPWPTVILQGHSNEPIVAEEQEAFVKATASYVKSLKQNSMTPVLFMTWAYENAPEMTLPLSEAYTKVGNRLNIQVVPVGLAFAHVRKMAPDISLYTADVLGVNKEGKVTYRRDIKHPSRAGTYLAACVFYAAFYKTSPQGLPYTAGLEADIALQLQNLAWESVRDYYSWQNSGNEE